MGKVPIQIMRYKWQTMDKLPIPSTQVSLDHFEWGMGSQNLPTDCYGKLNECNVIPSQVLFASGCKTIIQGSPQDFSEVWGIHVMVHRVFAKPGRAGPENFEL